MSRIKQAGDQWQCWPWQNWHTFVW